MTRFFTLSAFVASCALSGLVSSAEAQDQELHILAIQATPVGALPPIALTMPASRNHHYWGIRAQTGRRTGSGGAELRSFAGGVDLQYRGGSTLGATVGYQAGDCYSSNECADHWMFGVRTRINLFTGGGSVASMFGDHSATSTIGTEIGVGYAPNVLPGFSPCTIDVSLPFYIAMLQRVRLVTFVSPGVVWDVDCSDEGGRGQMSFMTGAGFGFQQLGHRGLDVYFGAQKFYLGDTGIQFGVSASYVFLPWGR